MSDAALADLDRRRCPRPPGVHSLREALVVSSWHPDLPVLLDKEWALRKLRKLVGDVGEWERHPLRTKEEVLTLVGRALGLLGEKAPRRGGRHVSSGPSRVSP